MVTNAELAGKLDTVLGILKAQNAELEELKEGHVTLRTKFDELKDEAEPALKWFTTISNNAKAVLWLLTALASLATVAGLLVGYFTKSK